MTEAGVGMVPLEDKEGQGLLAATRRWESFMEQILLQSFQNKSTPLILQLLGSRNFCCFKPLSLWQLVPTFLLCLRIVLLQLDPQMGLITITLMSQSVQIMSRSSQHLHLIILVTCPSLIPDSESIESMGHVDSEPSHHWPSQVF